GLDVSHIKKEDISQYTNRNLSEMLRKNSTIIVLIVAIIAGVSLNFYSKKEKLMAILKKISHYLFVALHRVMLLAPIGAFGGMAYTISKYGLEALYPLAKLMFTVYATMAVFIFGVLYLI